MTYTGVFADIWAEMVVVVRLVVDLPSIDSTWQVFSIYGKSMISPLRQREIRCARSDPLDATLCG